jgi:hypothetical protein
MLLGFAIVDIQSLCEVRSRRTSTRGLVLFQCGRTSDILSDIFLDTGRIVLCNHHPGLQQVKSIGKKLLNWEQQAGLLSLVTSSTHGRHKDDFRKKAQTPEDV